MTLGAALCLHGQLLLTVGMQLVVRLLTVSGLLEPVFQFEVESSLMVLKSLSD